MTSRDRNGNRRYRILVVANETADGEALHRRIVERAVGKPAEVLVVAPAPAQTDRVTVLVDRLETEDIAAQGWEGDPDPLEAIADALSVFAADELIISTHPEWRSSWLENDLVGLARELSGLPTSHVVVHGRPHSVGTVLTHLGGRHAASLRTGRRAAGKPLAA
jgi:hypothetical protein